MVSVPVPPPSREAGSNNHPRFNDDVVNSSHVVLERDKVGSIVLVAGATDRDGDVLWYFIAGERVLVFLILFVVVVVKEDSKFYEADRMDGWMGRSMYRRKDEGMEYVG